MLKIILKRVDSFAEAMFSEAVHKESRPALTLGRAADNQRMDLYQPGSIGIAFFLMESGILFLSIGQTRKSKELF